MSQKPLTVIIFSENKDFYDSFSQKLFKFLIDNFQEHPRTISFQRCSYFDGLPDELLAFDGEKDDIIVIGYIPVASFSLGAQALFQLRLQYPGMKIATIACEEFREQFRRQNIPFILDDNNIYRSIQHVIRMVWNI